LRLAVVSPVVDKRHGTERAVAELVERLARDYGCEIHLYAQRVEDIALSDSRTEHTKKLGAIFWRRVPAIPGPHLAQFIAWVCLNGFLRRWHALLGSGSYDLVLTPGINCLHPDFVIVHALFHRLKELASKINGDASPRVGLFRRAHRRAYYGLLTFLERRIYSNPNIVLATVSKRTANLLASFFDRKEVSVIPNGVDTALFSPVSRLSQRAEARKKRNFEGGDFVLLLIGNDWRNKGLPTVLEALGNLSSLPLKLLVVGTDNAKPFQARAEQLGVQDLCSWEAPSANVLEFYAAADLYVSPSLEDSFGLPVAEAMACGLPVITSKFAGVADHVEDGVDGFVLQNPQDAKALAERIQHLQTEPILRARLGEAAARKVAGLTWDIHAKAVWDQIRSISSKSTLVR